jgi:hypothetical protein
MHLKPAPGQGGIQAGKGRAHTCENSAFPTLLLAPCSRLPFCRRSQIMLTSLNGAARQIMTDLVVTRMNAVRQNCRAEVKFNTSGLYEIWVDENRNNNKDAGEVRTINIKTNYSDVNITRAITIIFNSRGVATTWGYTRVANSKGSKDIYAFMGGHVKIM